MQNILELERLGFFRHVAPEAPDRVRGALAEHGLGCLSSPSDGVHFEEETHRFHHVDAEELAEGAALNVLGLIAPFLRHEGVAIEVTYGEVRFPSLPNGPWGPARPVRRGRIELDDRGWPSAVGTFVTHDLVLVERMRLATSPGSALADVTQHEGADDTPYVLHVGDRSVVMVDPISSVNERWTRPPQNLIAFVNEILGAYRSLERAYAFKCGNDLAIVFATPEMASLVNAVAEPWNVCTTAAPPGDLGNAWERASGNGPRRRGGEVLRHSLGPRRTAARRTTGCRPTSRTIVIGTPATPRRWADELRRHPRRRSGRP